ncbi:MAG: minor capsid protein [Eggerthellaceae bacterium]|nr:minor capsid protein [Eggerthellaceae bacterium]MCH4220484.1 minor capsid protein [Eggerthellaceae bacterium]
MTVERNLGDIDRQFANLDLVQQQLAERVAKDSNEYCPVDTGSLQRSMTIKGDTITWPSKYASFVYYGTCHIHGVHTNKNPKATMAWFETAKSKHQDEWCKLVEDALNK